ncbi:YadA-like family protein [Bradyrhizobium septentrionale]|nr:YadA-like family protein [Bradyrhizobium septentrionale]UGY16323.1 YadA-like family protein [Bradyrhizobium septentrionale]
MLRPTLGAVLFLSGVAVWLSAPARAQVQHSGATTAAQNSRPSGGCTDQLKQQWTAMGGALDCGEQKPAQVPQSDASVKSLPAAQSVSTPQPVTQGPSPKTTISNEVKSLNDRPTATGASPSKTNGDLGAASDGLTASNHALQVTNNALAKLTNDIGNGTIGLVRQTDANAAVTIAAKTGGRLVDLTGGDDSRTLRGITNGAVSPQSSDALTGQQLYRSADSVATWLGGGSHVNPDGTVSQPSYAVLGGIYHDVASALNAASTNSIQYDVSADGHRLNSVTLQGGSPGTVALHNVAAGTAANDATNLKQLNDALAVLGADDRAYTDRKVAEVDRHARAAGSAAMAAAGLAFSDEAKGDRSVAIAIGTFRDSISLAGGLAYRVSDAVRVKASVSYTPDTGDVGGSASLGVRF